MYQKDKLREYISNSEIRVFSDNIRVRLSKELASKYDNGSYYNYLKDIQKFLNMINTLNIQYPGNAHPTLYIYIVPDDSYIELLKFPKKFDKGRGGGKPVTCYDLDGFNTAYGLSQNVLENKKEETNIARIENDIHELSHLIHSAFFSKNQTISEGFAEALPLYGLDIEDIFTEHKNALLNLSEEQILSAQELLDSEKDDTYGIDEIIPNRSCSFRTSYISSYLLVRGILETIAEKYNFTKAQAIQHFLEIVKQSNCMNEWLIYDIANAIGILPDDLLNGKELQIKVINSLSNKHLIK